MPSELRTVFGSLIGVLPCLLVQSAWAQGVDLFRTTPTFDVGDGPTAIVTCDLNQDGRPDVVTANELFQDISVLLNDGAGGFFPQVRFGVRSLPRDLVCEDLDEDGKLDVATAYTLLRGNGDGTFAVETHSLPGAPGGVLGMATGDFNGDDHVDIVLGGESGVRFLFGPPDFSEEYPYHDGFTTDNSVLGHVTVADLDGDQNLDVVAALSNVSIFWGRGDGSFEIASVPHPGSTVSSVTTADVDGDTSLDLIFSNYSTNNVTVKRGLGSRSFDVNAAIEMGQSPSQVLVNDVNGDGQLDIVTANEAANDVSVRLGRGDLTFQTEVRFGVGDDPSGLVVEDFDDDGKLDAVTSNGASNDVSLMLGNGDGTFRWEPRFPVGANPRAVAACDLNHDGIVDLASVNRSPDNVSVLIGLGGGSYLPEVRYPTAEGPVAIACADFKEDGHPDLVIANQASSEVSVLLGIGDGTFLAKPRFSVGPDPDDLDVCDLNEDGHLDVVTANGSTLSILFGQGNGFFLPEVRLDDDGLLIRCTDVNGDEHDDLVYVEHGYIVTLRGNGDGTFQGGTRTDSSDSPTGLFVADINEDGYPDAVVVSASLNEWRYHRGRFDGWFLSANPLHLAGQEPRSALVYDIDGNDLMDVLITNSGSNDVSVFPFNGSTAFEDERWFGVGEEPWISIAADVDNDSDDDLIVANSVSNSLSVLFNTAIELQIDPNDLDGDGIPNDTDNCPETQNVAQADFDNDRLGDACDPDIDNDGIHNGPDVCDFTPLGASVQTNGTLQADVDGDCDVDLMDFFILQQELTGTAD